MSVSDQSFDETLVLDFPNEQPRVDHAYELEGKLTTLARRGRVSLTRLMDEHGADTGLPDNGMRWRGIARMRGQQR